MRKEVDFIQDAIDGVPGMDEAEDSTIARWRKVYIPKLEAALSAAGFAMPKKEPGRRWLSEILTKIYKNKQKHTHYAFSPEAGAG